MIPDAFVDDGCSVPRALGWLYPALTPAQQLACRRHDWTYQQGGTRRQRAIGDAELLLDWLLADMDVDQAEQWHTVVRVAGKPHWDGGRYTDERMIITRDGEIVEAPS